MHKQMLLVLFAILLISACASAKFYSLPKANIQMQINSDASIDASETITFQFNGSFSYAYRDFPNGTWDISNIQVTENGEPLQFTQSPENGNLRV